MGLVERIKEKCTEKGTTIKALEREIGLGNGTISRWNTNVPSYDKVIKVADFLQTSFYWLIFGKEAGDLTPEELQLVNYYRNTNKIGQGLTMQVAKANSEALPAEQQLSISMTGSTGTDN